ncbi:unnamed protein product [Pocillopora meandrina]|uniref:Uncharacterized protein n=1 Tax=Pocillopora meandrina TaxID=46732 RepID=A0AAU9XP85_9CNID|nr:unnamed protein product [Pocillopora meandrina]
MECDDKKGYIYCAHCNDFVSRSTFEAHERKRNETNLADTFKATSNSQDLFNEISISSEDEDVKKKQPTDLPESEVAYSNSDNECGGLNSTNDGHRSDCCSSSSDGDEEEIWNGVHPEIMSRDLENAPPLPEAQGRQNSLIFWFVYFLLIW